MGSMALGLTCRIPLSMQNLTQYAIVHLHGKHTVPYKDFLENESWFEQKNRNAPGIFGHHQNQNTEYRLTQSHPTTSKRYTDLVYLTPETIAIETKDSRNYFAHWTRNSI